MSMQRIMIVIDQRILSLEIFFCDRMEWRYGNHFELDRYTDHGTVLLDI